MDQSQDTILDEWMTIHCRWLAAYPGLYANLLFDDERRYAILIRFNTISDDELRSFCTKFQSRTKLPIIVSMSTQQKTHYKINTPMTSEAQSQWSFYECDALNCKLCNLASLSHLCFCINDYEHD